MRRDTEAPVLFSFCYLVLRQVLQLLVLRSRSDDCKELEILVLRHELAMLRRRTSQPVIGPLDRIFVSAASRLSRATAGTRASSPGELLRWHRRWATKRWTYAGRRGRRPIQSDIRRFAIRLAREHPRWGDQRIVGELKSLGVVVAATTVRNWLRALAPWAPDEA